MARKILQAALMFAMVGLGWAVAKAQMPAPEFEQFVNSPSGETTVTCVRGCTLMWVERGINENSTPTASFTFRCGGTGGPPRCSSGRVGGWIAP